MNDHSHKYREIITKAVCGSGKRSIRSTDHVIPAYKPASILGCWVINHQYHAKKTDASIVEVHGSYDINIWYSYDENRSTEVVKEKIDYCDKVELTNEDIHCFHHEDEVMVKVIQQPNCLECKIKDENRIAVDIEKEFLVDIIGETKVRVQVDTTQPQHQKKMAFPKEKEFK